MTQQEHAAAVAAFDPRRGNARGTTPASRVAVVWHRGLTGIVIAAKAIIQANADGVALDSSAALRAGRNDIWEN